MGFEVTEYNINVVPDSIPSYMGVCVVRYLDSAGVPYFGTYGRNHSIFDSSYFPIPPISVSDSIYGGVMSPNRVEELMLFGYPGKYEVPIMFPINYLNYWSSQRRLPSFPFVDTLSVSISANCTTYVDAQLPGSSKLLIENWFVPGETPFSRGPGRRGKLRILTNSGAESLLHIITSSNSSSWVRWTKTNRNHTMYENSLSLEEGYHSVDLILPYLHSIRLDSVFVSHGEETQLLITIPEKEPLPAQESLESLLEYPDEWSNPRAYVNTLSTIRLRADDEKTGNLIYSYLVTNEAAAWSLISVFRNGVYKQDSDAGNEWYPVDQYISNVHSIDASGSRVLLNIVNQETGTPSLLQINFDGSLSQITNYAAIDIAGSGIGYTSIPSSGMSLTPELNALENGTNAFLANRSIRLFNRDFSKILWEVDSLPNYACGLCRIAVFSDNSDRCLIVNRHTMLSAPVIIVDSLGGILEIPELSEGRFELIFASSSFDTLLYRRQDEGSVHLGVQRSDSQLFSDSVLIDGGIAFCKLICRGERFVAFTEDSLLVFEYPNIEPSCPLFTFPSSFFGWLIAGFSLLEGDILVLNLRNQNNEDRHMAIGLESREILWLSPIRSSYSRALHTFISRSASLFPWNDGVIRLMEFSDVTYEEINSREQIATEL